MMARRPKLVEIGKPITDCHEDDSLDYTCNKQEPSVLSLKSYSYNSSSNANRVGGKKGNVRSKIIIGKPKEQTLSVSNPYTDSSWYSSSSSFIRTGQPFHQQEDDDDKDYYSFSNNDNYRENESMTFMDVDDDDNIHLNATNNNHHHHHWDKSTHPNEVSSFLHPSNNHFNYEFGNHAGQKDGRNDRPLIVLDGANIAYAYSDFLLEKEPNVKGIALAVDYFQCFGNIQVVLPSYFMNKKLLSKEYSLMQTDSLDILHSLKQKHYLCLTPPTDDDDAYMIAMATSYQQKSTKQQQINHAFIVSNDLFRDAIQRYQNNHHSIDIHHWLTSGNGRISYSFFNIGGNSIDNNNRVVPKIEFIPNPRHSFIETIQQQQQSRDNFNFPS